MTPTQQSTIIAVFPDAATAQAAAKDLLSAGISRENMFLESSRTGTGTSGSSSVNEPGTSMPEHHGGVGGWFKSLFGGEDEAEANRYQEAIGRGNVILSVHSREDQYEKIADILDRHNPIDIHEGQTAARSSTAGATGTTAAATAGTTGATTAATAGRQTAQTAQTATTGNAATREAIPVVQEELQVGKRRILRGGVRVYSRVVERPVEESINLTEDHVRVDRRPVDRPVTDADLRTKEGGVIEVQEFAEEPVVAKSARVVEEVRVGKETTQRTENVRDSVRHTEVNVEQIPGNQGVGTANAGYDDTDFRNDFKTRYGATGGSYETYAPAYRYGYEMAGDPRYKGRSYNEVESQLKSDYASRYPNSAWDKMKDSVRYGWDKMTGHSRAAGR